MARLYVPLDVDFATDDKILRAGPVASYLFICSLAHAKRTLSDGIIATSQLPALTIGLRGRATKHVQTLVDVGLWEPIAGGWRIPSWSKRNSSKADIEASSLLARDAGVRGNHDRWHVGEGGQASSRCPLCVAIRSESHRVPDRVPDRGGDSGTRLGGAIDASSGGAIGVPSGGAIAKTKTKTKTESKTETETEKHLPPPPDLRVVAPAARQEEEEPVHISAGLAEWMS